MKLEAEARSAHAAGGFGSRRKNFLEDPLLLTQREPSPSSRTRKRTRPSWRRALDAAACRRVLDRVLDQVGEHLPKNVRVDRDLGEAALRRKVDRDPVRDVNPRRLDDLEGEGPWSQCSTANAKLPSPGGWPRAPGRRSAPGGPTRPRSRRAVAHGGRRRAPRPGAAGSSRRRRSPRAASQLVRDRGHELALQLLDAALLGQVAVGHRPCRRGTGPRRWRSRAPRSPRSSGSVSACLAAYTGALAIGTSG